MKDYDVDWLLAMAQVIFAGLLLASIVGLVFVLVLFHTQLSETGTTILTSVIAALITILTLMMNFFYARSRPQALPDPSNTTTTTTSITNPPPLVIPEGSKVVAAPTPPVAIIHPLVPTPEKPS